MPLILSQLIALAPYKRKQMTVSSTDVSLTKSNAAVSAAARHDRAKEARLQVTISKEPPSIVYFERRQGEASFECIFDPDVCHDNEDDHPDLCHKRRKLKPWQLPPYTDKFTQTHTSHTSRILKLFKFRLRNKSVGVKPDALSTAEI